MLLNVLQENAAHRHHDISACNGWITQPTVLIAGECIMTTSQCITVV